MTSELDAVANHYKCFERWDSGLQTLRRIPRWRSYAVASKLSAFPQVTNERGVRGTRTRTEVGPTGIGASCCSRSSLFT